MVFSFSIQIKILPANIVNSSLEKIVFSNMVFIIRHFNQVGELLFRNSVVISLISDIFCFDFFEIKKIAEKIIENSVTSAGIIDFRFSK